MNKISVILSSYFSFIIWFLPRQMIKKEVQIERLDGKLHVKSDVYDGFGKKLNFYSVLFWRYSLVLFLILSFIPFGAGELLVFLAALVIGATIAALFFYNKKIALLSFLIELSILGSLLLLKLEFDFIMTFFYSISFTMAFSLFFLTLNDYSQIVKNNSFYLLHDVKIIIRIK